MEAKEGPAASERAQTDRDLCLVVIDQHELPSEAKVVRLPGSSTVAQLVEAYNAVAEKSRELKSGDQLLADNKEMRPLDSPLLSHRIAPDPRAQRVRVRRAPDPDASGYTCADCGRACRLLRTEPVICPWCGYRILYKRREAITRSYLAR